MGKRRFMHCDNVNSSHTIIKQPGATSMRRKISINTVKYFKNIL